MKLSFSTNYWHNYTFDQFISIAAEYRFSGIEIHDVQAVLDPAEPGKTTAIYRKLIEKRLNISCIDLVADIAGDINAALNELALVLDAAKRLHAPYVRIRTSRDDENAAIAAKDFISRATPRPFQGMSYVA